MWRPLDYKTSSKSSDRLMAWHRLSNDSTFHWTKIKTFHSLKVYNKRNIYGFFFFLSTLVVVYSFECCHWSKAASSKYEIKGGYARRIEITVQIVGVSVFTYMLAQTVKKTPHTWNPFALLSWKLYKYSRNPNWWNLEVLIGGVISMLKSPHVTLTQFNTNRIKKMLIL